MTRTISPSSSSSSASSCFSPPIKYQDDDVELVAVGESCRQSNKMCSNDTSQQQQARLCDEFISEYKKFSKDFDHLSQDSFAGEKLNEISQDFLANCCRQHQCAAKICYSIVANSTKSSFPNCSNGEALNEDLKLVSGDLKTQDASECARILANVYRRACQGYYLLITWKKSRQNRESDRWRAVEFGRHAIRYDPTNFEACYWYMIALGWQLDVTNSPRERTLVARTFYETTKYCTELEPMDPLSYHLRGRYYYNVAGLSWIEKKVADKLLGASMNGTYQDAEREFRRAHQLKDDWLPGGLWMARVLLSQKKPIEEVRQWIDLSSSMECLEPSTELEMRDLLELKSKLKLN